MARIPPFLAATVAAALLLPGCATVAPTQAAKSPDRLLASLGDEADDSRPSPLAQDGMRPIAPHVYVDPDMPAGNTPKLLNVMQKARVRAAYFYGELLAQPDILFCASMECYRKYGGVGLGYTVGNTILISPYGARAAIVSHELSHAELAARLGGQRQAQARVPQWFDEGTAVMVSLAYEFSDEAWRAACNDGETSPRLSDLETRAGWQYVTGANGANMQLSYGTARQEVIRWYAQVGKKGLNQLIQALKANQNFHAAYRNIEDSAGMILAAKDKTVL